MTYIRNDAPNRDITKWVNNLLDYRVDSPSSVARTRQSKDEERVSVKDFGAKGDGVTDDSEAFQAALDHLPDEGGTIYIPKGSYYITKEITQAKQGIEIVGDGAAGGSVVRAASEIITDKNIYCFSLGDDNATHHNGPSIRNIGFRDISESGTAKGGLKITRMNFIYLENINFHDFTGGEALVLNGTSADYVQYGAIVNMRCRNCKQGINAYRSNGIHVFAGLLLGKNVSESRGINLYECDTWIIRAPVQEWETSVYAYNVKYCEFSARVEETGATSDTAVGYYINGDSTVACQDNVIRGGSINKCNIGIDIGSNAIRTIIENPLFANNNTNIRVHANAEPFTFITSHLTNSLGKITRDSIEGDAILYARCNGANGREYSLESLTDGEGRIRNRTIGNDEISLKKDGGVSIPAESNGKLTFFGGVPIERISFSGEISGHTSVGGSGVSSSDTFTGNWGATEYTINDIVKALKQYRLLRA